MATLAVSILSADFAHLAREISNIERNGGDWIHFDVMDGNFVPNISIGIPVLQSVRKITKLPLDVHLMIERPIRYVERFINAGADRITIHAEADTPENTLAALEKIKAGNCKSAICLKPQTQAEAAIPYLEKCDMILLMTVEPGFGGQKFMENMMPKLRSLRSMLDKVNPSCVLEVDGGIDENTGALCTGNGADILVSGSAYFQAEDPQAYVRRIHQL